MVSCNNSRKLQQQMKNDFSAIWQAETKPAFDADTFLQELYSLPVKQREDSLLKKMLSGEMPLNNFKFKKVNFKSKDANGKDLNCSIWVSPDYLSIGKNANFIRMPLTPQAAQLVADKLKCVLPTTKMVDEIYAAAKIKLAPLPLTEARDSLPTFIYHNKLIEEQLANITHSGIVAGIKKDVVQSMAVVQNDKPNRVAIYGWHKPDGNPIQPLYTGHVDWYVDYSHGIRLVYEMMIINNKIIFVKDVLNNPLLAPSICKDSVCGAMKYTAVTEK